MLVHFAVFSLFKKWSKKAVIRPGHTGTRSGPERSDVEVLHIERIIFDKLTPGFDLVAH